MFIWTSLIGDKGGQKSVLFDSVNDVVMSGNFVAVGASPADDRASKQLIQQNSKELYEHIPCFYARGAWDLKGMHLLIGTYVKC